MKTYKMEDELIHENGSFRGLVKEEEDGLIEEIELRKRADSGRG